MMLDFREKPNSTVIFTLYIKGNEKTMPSPIGATAVPIGPQEPPTRL